MRSLSKVHRAVSGTLSHLGRLRPSSKSYHTSPTSNARGAVNACRDDTSQHPLLSILFLLELLRTHLVYPIQSGIFSVHGITCVQHVFKGGASRLPRHLRGQSGAKLWVCAANSIAYTPETQSGILKQLLAFYCSVSPPSTSATRADTRKTALRHHRKWQHATFAETSQPFQHPPV